MFSLQWFYEKITDYRASMIKRYLDESIIDEIIKLNDNRKKIVGQYDEINKKRYILGKKIHDIEQLERKIFITNLKILKNQSEEKKKNF